jgi:hypothetical protein
MDSPSPSGRRPEAVPSNVSGVLRGARPRHKVREGRATACSCDAARTFGGMRSGDLARAAAFDQLMPLLGFDPNTS